MQLSCRRLQEATFPMLCANSVLIPCLPSVSKFLVKQPIRAFSWLPSGAGWLLAASDRNSLLPSRHPNFFSSLLDRSRHGSHRSPVQREVDSLPSSIRLFAAEPKYGAGPALTMAGGVCLLQHLVLVSIQPPAGARLCQPSLVPIESCRKTKKMLPSCWGSPPALPIWRKRPYKITAWLRLEALLGPSVPTLASTGPPRAGYPAPHHGGVRDPQGNPTPSLGRPHLLPAATVQLMGTGRGHS